MKLTKAKRKLGPEEAIQQGFIEETYRLYPVGTDREILLTCSPAGYKMPKLMRIKFSQWAAKMGYRKGTLDVTILEPRGEYHGLFIEFKSPKGSLEPEQKEVIRLLQARGYAVAVCKSIEHANKVRDWYLGLKK